MQKRLWAQRVLAVFILLTLAFIFGNSMLPEKKSSAASKATAQTIQSVVTQQGAKEPNPAMKRLISHVRKTAHVVEFFVLGAELAALSFIHEKPSFKSLYLLFTTIVLTAVTDETIQIFSLRGPLVQDILLDVYGGSIAMLLALLVYLLIWSIQKYKNNRKKNAVK